MKKTTRSTTESKEASQVLSAYVAAQTSTSIEELLTSSDEGSHAGSETMGEAEESTVTIDYAYPIPPDLDKLKPLLREWLNADTPDSAQSFRHTIEGIIETTLNQGGMEGLEALIILYKQIESEKKLREVQATPFYDRYQSFKLLIDEDDHMRRLVQRQVIRWMLNHPDEFRDSKGKLRAITNSFKFSITEKSDRPLIINSSVSDAIKLGNQRFEEALSQMSNASTEAESNPIADATIQFFMALITHLWTQLPVSPEFLKLNVTVELDEEAIKKALINGEDLGFAKLGEPSRWLTFSSKGRAN